MFSGLGLIVQKSVFRRRMGKHANQPLEHRCFYVNEQYFRGTQRKARDKVIHNNICSSELARICGMSYISQLGSVKNTHLAARNPILHRILTARGTIKRYINQLGKLILNQFSDRPQRDHYETPSH